MWLNDLLAIFLDVGHIFGCWGRGQVIIELDYQLGDSVKVLGKQEPTFDWVLSESESNLVTGFLGSLCL